MYVYTQRNLFVNFFQFYTVYEYKRIVAIWILCVCFNVASYIGCALQDMVKSPFEKIHVFSMKVVSKDTKTVLIQYPGCQFSRDHLFYFFDNIAAVSEEKDSCHVFPKLFMAVITFEKMSGK